VTKQSYPRDPMAEARRLIVAARGPENYSDQLYPHSSQRYNEARALAAVATVNALEDIAQALGHILTTLENIEVRMQK
jgi:hypothetical protein